jgi:hypothetical protein
MIASAASTANERQLATPLPPLVVRERIAGSGLTTDDPIADIPPPDHNLRMLPRALKRLFSRSKPTTAQDLLEAGRDVEPQDRDLSLLIPIILPVELLGTDWPGPIVRIGQLPFCVAWAIRGEMNTFFYVSHRDAEYWDKAEVDWQTLAFRNLVAMAQEQPASGYKDDDEGRPFVQVLLHADAIGPSRLLVPHLFDDVLGEGYDVAIPEQTCAIAYRKNLSAEQAADIDAMVNGCFKHGTEPMSAERYPASAFWDVVSAPTHV